MFAADQYVHGYNTCVLEEMGNKPSSFYHEWFRFNTFPEPNWVGHGLLWVLAKAVPMYIAEKVFVLLLVLGNGYAFLSTTSPLSSSKNTRSSDKVWPWQTAAALFSLIFLFSSIWQLGFVNYLLGMVAMIVGLTHTSRLKSSKRIAVIGWGLFTYFCHPIAFLFYMGTFSLQELLERHLLSPYLKPLKGDWGAFLKSFFLWFGLPLILLIAYLATHSEVSTFRGASPWRLLAFPYYHNDLSLFDLAELSYAKLALFSGIAMLVWGAYQLFRQELNLTLSLVGAGVLLAAIVFAPDYFAGGALIHQRLIPILFIWCFWCAAQAVNHQEAVMPKVTLKLGYAFTLTAAIACVGLTYHRSKAVPVLVDVLDEFREFSAEFPPGTAILPVSASATSIVVGQELSLKPVLHHFAATMDCSKEVVLLDNYEAFVGYFPLLWKEGRNSFVELSRGLEQHPAVIQTEGKTWFYDNVDYILTMGPPEAAFMPETAVWVVKRFGESKTSKNGNFHLIKVKK